MKRTLLAISVVFLFLSLCSAQQTRVGDAFRGPLKQVRTARTRVRVENGTVVEGPRTLVQVINYSEDGLSREIQLYNGNSIQRKTVERYRPDGNRDSTSTYESNETLISKVVYEYNPQGRLTSELRFNNEGSITDRRMIQTSSKGQQLVVTKSSGSGVPVERSVNTREAGFPTTPGRRSVWTTTKEDGSRVENIFEVDASGTHNDQQLEYDASGSLVGRRVSIVDAEAKRLEATEYDATGNVKNRTLETREYDSRHNLIKLTNFKWNSQEQNFEPFVISYHEIEYY